MQIIKICKYQCFCVGYTEGYVIAKCLFGYMGVLIITGGTGFNNSTLAKSDQVMALEVDFEEGIKGLVEERLSLK